MTHALRVAVATVALAAAALFVAPTAPAVTTTPVPSGVQLPFPAISWQGAGNPYVFTISDSIINGCTLEPEKRAGNSEGIGWRDLGRVSWPGATTQMQRDRLQGVGSWPDSTMTEDAPGGPNVMEQTWFHTAGALVIMLGTNDAYQLTPDQYRDNVRWFVEQQPNRPVVWINGQNPSTADLKQQALNQVLTEEAATHPNMKVVDWHAFIANGHRWDVRSDGVHIADGYGCEDLFRLIATAVPGVPGDDAPRGYWYGAEPTTSGVSLTGWAAAWSNPRTQAAHITVRVNWQEVGQWPIYSTSASPDDWAVAASGRAWSVIIPPASSPRVVCVDAYDDAGQRAELGCRWV